MAAAVCLPQADLLADPRSDRRRVPDAPGGGFTCIDAAVYLLVPALDTIWSKIKAKVLAAVCTVLLACFSADAVYSAIVPNMGEGITDYSAYQEAE